MEEESLDESLPGNRKVAGFPEEVQEDVDGLSWLGYLEDEFTFGGHNFVIRTLRGEEELLAGLVTKDYVETLGQAKAQVWAHISLALVAVDGDEDFCPPIGRDRKDYARARFQYCSQKWFWPLALFIYNRYAELTTRQDTCVEELQDLFEGSLTTFMPSSDSSTDRASSEEEEPEEDIRDYLNPED